MKYLKKVISGYRDNTFSKAIQILSVIALLTLPPSGSVSVMAQGDVTVTINAPAEVVEGSDFTATVDVTNLVNFDAGQFDISFDQSILRLDGITAGLIGSTEIPVNWNDLEPGICIAVMNIPGLTGVSGSGYLAKLHFHAVGPSSGSSAIELSNIFLNDNLAAEITASWNGDSVVVNEQSGGILSSPLLVPIAASVAGVVLVGLLFFWIRRRRDNYSY